MDFFQNRLRPQIDHYLTDIVTSLSNQYTIQQAKDSVPLASIVQDNLNIVEQEDDFNENLLPYLVDWFSGEFFNWFSPPNCTQCDKKLEYSHSTRNVENLQVEHYKCIDESRCRDSSYQFIRHNDPAILLNTRQGRCGEWAKCFLVILKALDYDARIVLDITDHVWNEVWSESKQKWIHVDPCESVIDSPLLYEVGWKKKLQYCIAISNFEVIDVTARYVKNFSETIKHRPFCDLELYEKYVDQLTNNILESVPEEVRSLVLHRRKIDMLFLKNISKLPQSVEGFENFGGRKTGSIQWRIERGEYNPINDNKFIIKVNRNSEKPSTVFKLRYNCDRNRYDSSQEGLNEKKWISLVYYAQNIDFKYERDWKCSYLARYETCPHSESGKIKWRFDIMDIRTLTDWRSFKVCLKGKIYCDTFINLKVLVYNDASEELKRFEIELNKVNILRLDDLPIAACRYVQIDAELGGGNSSDPVAWQKPQLFRQTRSLEDNHDLWPFEVEFC